MFPSNPSPAKSDPATCNQYLPSTNTMDRFMWVINYFASNGFYVVSKHKSATQLAKRCAKLSCILCGKLGPSVVVLSGFYCLIFLLWCSTLGGYHCSCLSCVQLGTISKGTHHKSQYTQRQVLEPHSTKGEVLSWSQEHAQCSINCL